ncbi:MAG TPA: hypothetical protein PKW18_01790 [Candidatus Sumerlaeota bacterium]|nr:MAG: hypothetical protein BWY12_00273 [candidate division BRC1 bacterium ADurb.Bin183]HOE62207.1 hypothetical protein [Candidatus Sumerlaeota bacterium]HRR30970.1 hypothetical protein [Candidatus Sumerlaeia bacterium]HON49122.1 hypothetical protein [Candidatus Sumerlaeota bacterium]HOR64271.1 hypothetical protein [Candidatus Sumerlaeota bacterium]
MKKMFLFITLIALLCSMGFAQDLDTTEISDQFTIGKRGNESGTRTSGGAEIDGSEYLDQPPIAGEVVGTIRYINSWAGASGGGDATYGESGIFDCTVAHPIPDRDIASGNPAIPANTRPGATSPDKCILIGDDGGFNCLFFGESDDADYYIEVDGYCYDRSGGGAANYENIAVFARAGRDNDPNITEYTYNYDRAGSYCLMYDSYEKKAKAVKWTTGNSSGNIAGRVASTFTLFGEVDATEGWHTFRVECKGSNIKFSFDGVIVADVTDTEFINGRPGFGYREANWPSAEERQGHFDNLKAGPAVSSVCDWNLF